MPTYFSLKTVPNVDADMISPHNVEIQWLPSCSSLTVLLEVSAQLIPGEARALTVEAFPSQEHLAARAPAEGDKDSLRKMKQHSYRTHPGVSNTRLSEPWAQGTLRNTYNTNQDSKGFIRY